MRTPVAAAVLLALFLPVAARASREEALKAEDAGNWKGAAALWVQEAGSNAEHGAWEHAFRALEAVGDLDHLTSLAAEARTRFPDWDGGARAIAWAAAYRGKWAEAAQALNGVETLAARAARARYLDEAGKPEDARPIWEGIRRDAAGLSHPAPLDEFAAAEAARWAGDYEGAAQMFERAYRDSLDFLDARLALARLFQAKYQENLAGEELTDAQKVAPRHPDLEVAIAEIAAASTRFTLAEAAARNALAIRPGDPAPRRVQAFLSLVADEPGTAEKAMNDLLGADPGDFRARSLLAAALYLKGDRAGWERERDRVLAQRPNDATLFLSLARILELSHRDEEAFALYDQVLARDPKHSGALIAKGLLLMREGKEKEARANLEKGFEGDRFNIRAYNQLELLDKMDTFTSYRTPHFEIRLEADQDSLFVPELEASLERLRSELVPRHEYTPKEPTVVEVFPTHDWFSARVTGLPWLEGIPAVCFGDVVAMDSPRTIAGASNWEDVLRHEYGHVLALGLSERKVPHWFTEGLSVSLEHFPRGEWWDAALVAASMDHRFVPVDSLTIAFTRPRTQGDRLLAYYQSGLILRDLEARYGFGSVPKLLRAFAQGKTLEQAIPEVLGESYADFCAHAMALVSARADSLPVWPQPDPSRSERLQNEIDGQGETVDRLEALAVAQIQEAHNDDATATAKKLLGRDPGNARALGILGMVSEAEERDAEARTRYRDALDHGSRDLPVIHALGRLDLAAGDTAAALEDYSREIAIYPLAMEARKGKARILAARGDRAGAEKEYRDLIAIDGTAGKEALDLARLEIRDGDGEQALAAALAAETALPVDADALALQGQALILLGRADEAYPLFLRARRVDVRSVETLVGMASFYEKRGDDEEALHFAQLALKYDPGHPVALGVKARVLGP